MNKEQNGIMIRNATKAGYLIAKEGDGIVLDKSDLRIRRLTPRECWRLQGFDDDDFEIAKGIGTSDSQLYKQAGNSIAVPCLEAILRAMFIDCTWVRAPTLECWA